MRDVKIRKLSPAFVDQASFRYPDVYEGVIIYQPLEIYHPSIGKELVNFFIIDNQDESPPRSSTEFDELPNGEDLLSDEYVKFYESDMKNKYSDKYAKRYARYNYYEVLERGAVLTAVVQEPRCLEWVGKNRALNKDMRSPNNVIDQLMLVEERHNIKLMF